MDMVVGLVHTHTHEIYDDGRTKRWTRDDAYAANDRLSKNDIFFHVLLPAGACWLCAKQRKARDAGRPLCANQPTNKHSSNNIHISHASPHRVPQPHSPNQAIPYCLLWVRPLAHLAIEVAPMFWFGVVMCVFVCLCSCVKLATDLTPIIENIELDFVCEIRLGLDECDRWRTEVSLWHFLYFSSNQVR